MPVEEGGCGAPPRDKSVGPALELLCASAQLTSAGSLASLAHLSTGGVAGSSCVRGKEGERGDGERDAVEESCWRTGEAQRGREILARQAQVNHNLDLTDFSQHEDYLAEGGVLPGEVSEDPPAYTPSFCRRTRLELSSRPDLKPRPPSPCSAVQTGAGEVQPFCLDAGFDYDRVTLSRKHPVP